MIGRYPAGSGLRGFSFISLLLRSRCLVILGASEGAGLDDPHVSIIIPLPGKMSRPPSLSHTTPDKLEPRDSRKALAGFRFSHSPRRSSRAIFSCMSIIPPSPAPLPRGGGIGRWGSFCRLNRSVERGQDFGVGALWGVVPFYEALVIRIDASSSSQT